MGVIGKITQNKGGLQILVPVIYFEEDGVYFAHLPHLDITGYGNNEKEAKKSLDVMVTEFFDYTTENKTLEKELMKLGWKKAPLRQPTDLTELISHNDQLKNIVNTKNIKTDRISVRMPA